MYHILGVIGVLRTRRSFHLFVKGYLPPFGIPQYYTSLPRGWIRTKYLHLTLSLDVRVSTFELDEVLLFLTSSRPFVRFILVYLY